MRDEIDWELVRQGFPVTERWAYLNSAAAGPVSREVSATATSFYRQMMEDGDAGWEDWLARREDVRASVARFINAEPDEIGFTTNTSSGMGLIVDALEGRGDVVSCDLEFPVTTIPWMHRGVRVRMVETHGGTFDAETLRRATSVRTKIISVSHVQYSNGFRADLEAIGREKGDCALVVNASQSAGVLEIDVKRMRVDALCATGHKWMLAGYGSGFVYLGRALLEETRARGVGWLSVEDPYSMRNAEFRVRDDASARAELGCPHFAGVFALGASVENFLRLGPQRIEQRALALNRYLTKRLAEKGRTVLSPIADESARSAETLVAAENPASVTAYLARRNVAVTEKPQGIRISTHLFNNEADVERLVESLEEVG